VPAGLFSTLDDEKRRIRDAAVASWQPRGILDFRNGVQEVGVEKSVEPSLVKVGPKGYIHGWIFVGTGDSVPHNGYAVQDVKHHQGKTRSEVWHHVFHDGEHIGMIMPSPSKKTLVAQPEMGEAKRVKTMKDALDHIAKKADVPAPPNAADANESSHARAMRLTQEANDDIKSAHSDIKNLALGPKQNAVLNHVHDAPDANPKNAAKHLRTALSALGASNPLASARLKQSLKKVNVAGKAWDEHFGFTTH
jgi:hypothetical protein